MGKQQQPSAIGIIQATDVAIAQLESSLSVTSNLDDLRRSVDDSVSVGWQYLINNLGTDVDRDHPTMRAALIVGGLVSDQALYRRRY